MPAPDPPFAAAFRLSATLLRRCVEDLDDAELLRRVSGETNHIAFLVLHLVDVRHLLLDLLGRGGDHPFRALVADARGIDDIPRFPSRQRLLTEWDRTADELDDALVSLDPATLAGPSPHGFPGGHPSLAGALTFLAQHEAYHVGQMALIRRTLGHPAPGWQ